MPNKLLFMTYFPPEMHSRQISFGHYVDQDEALAHSLFGLLIMDDDEVNLFGGGVRDKIGDSVTYNYTRHDGKELFFTRRHAQKPFSIAYHLIKNSEKWSGSYKLFSDGNENPYEVGYVNALIVDVPSTMFEIYRK